MTVIVKDLCADAAEPARVADFWGAVLGREWLTVNHVPEPKTVKNRVHLDLLVPDESVLVALGATRLADHGVFRVFADPEGNEFCAFPGEVLAASALCTDSADPVAAAAWWAGVTGATISPGPDGAPRYLDGVPGLGDMTWKFVGVPDARSVKNRWHWDVTADVDGLVGATVLREPDGGTRRTLLADPDGNEFCAFPTKR